MDLIWDVDVRGMNGRFCICVRLHHLDDEEKRTSSNFIFTNFIGLRGVISKGGDIRRNSHLGKFRSCYFSS